MRCEGLRVILMLGFITPGGNLTLGMGFYDTWKMRACVWELLSLLERCWASPTWTESCDLCWACSSVFSLRFSWKISLFASCGSCWACSARLGLLSPGEIPEFPDIRISVWSSRNFIHRSEAQLWLKRVEFFPWFKLGLSKNFVKKKKEVGEVVRNGQRCKQCPVMLAELRSRCITGAAPLPSWAHFVCKGICWKIAPRSCVQANLESSSIRGTEKHFMWPIYLTAIELLCSKFKCS